MNTTYGIASSFVFCLLVTTAVAAQEATEEGATGKTDNVIAETQAKVDDIGEQIDENEKAKEVSAGILQPIYALAEYLSFPAVHWVAFAIMATGVVTFALQLVLGKLVVLLKAGFSFTEILSDTLEFLNVSKLTEREGRRHEPEPHGLLRTVNFVDLPL